MLGKYSQLTEVNWANITLASAPTGSRMVGDSSVFGFVNWTMLPYISEIWKEMLAGGLSQPGRQAADPVRGPGRPGKADAW